LPHSWLFGAEPGFTHQHFEVGLTSEQCGIEDEVDIRRVRSDGDANLSLSGAEVDGLRADDDHGDAVRSQRGQRIQQNASSGHVQRIESGVSY
jgi:hypothetical protein